ncbi:MAG: aspartate-semialdehyde dehydrogenase [Desulfomonilia bacterium]
MTREYRIAVIEPISSTGEEIIKILEERKFPVKEVVPLGTPRSAGRSVEFASTDLRVKMLNEESLSGVDVAFFTTDRAACHEFAPKAVLQGCTVIDCSSEFSLKDTVPLVVPEINAGLLNTHAGIIASPGSLTIQLALALYPIHKAARIKRILVSTYQAVSESGPKAMDELTEQIRNLFTFREVKTEVYPRQIAFNTLPHVESFTTSDYTNSEITLIRETKKVLGDDSIRMSATNVRVPVFYSHSESVSLETVRKISPEEVRTMLNSIPGLVVQDDPARDLYPTALDATGRDECLVGRIREDFSFDNGLALWIVCDNLRKGSALNAVQILEHLVGNSL